MAAPALDTLLAQLGTRVAHAEELASFVQGPAPLSLGAALDDALPDGGLPRGVIELASPRALAGATSIAIAAVCAAQKKDARAWCAWLDPEGTLYAPGLARAGVDLARRLVIRPARADVARIAVKIAAARALDVIVIDMDPFLGVDVAPASPPRTFSKTRKPLPPETFVRKLALLAEEGGARILLLTDQSQPRRAQLPVALRLELERAPGSLTVKIAKDRRGRIGVKKVAWNRGGIGRENGDVAVGIG